MQKSPVHRIKLTFCKVNNTLLVDINRHSPAAAQASSKIVRCTLSAINNNYGGIFAGSV